MFHRYLVHYGIYVYKDTFNLDEEWKRANYSLNWVYSANANKKFLLEEMSATFNCLGDEMQLNGPANIWCTKDGNYSAAPPTCHIPPSKIIYVKTCFIH